MKTIEITLRRNLPQVMTAHIEVADDVAAEILRLHAHGDGGARVWAIQQAPLQGGQWRPARSVETPFAGFADIDVSVKVL